jgi:hypothetical protein
LRSRTQLNPFELQYFPMEPVAPEIARNNAFVPQFRCAPDRIDLISTEGEQHA